MYMLMDFENYGAHCYKLIEYPEKMTRENFHNIIQNIINKAKEDGFVGCLSDIPGKYYEGTGLTVSDTDTFIINDKTIGQTSYQKAGFDIARCRDCDSFEDGSCFKYGGILENPDDTEMDCIHFDDMITVYYDDVEAVKCYAINRDPVVNQTDIIHAFRDMFPEELNEDLIEFECADSLCLTDDDLE